MPDFNTQPMISWLHFVSLALAGGSMPVCLVLSGFEDTNEDIRGLSAAIWKKLTVWGMRCAVACGLALLVCSLAGGGRPFSQPHIMFKLPMAPILIYLCEAAPKALGEGKRGAALLAMALFLLASFVASNSGAFAKAEPGQPEAPAAEQLEHGAPAAEPQDAPAEPPMVAPLEI